MNSNATFHDQVIQIWIHVHEEYSKIISEIMGTCRWKLPVEKEKWTAMCWYTEQAREFCTETQQIFKYATGQRNHEAMYVDD